MTTESQVLSIVCDDTASLQRKLNDLYEYHDDILTKIYHRSRIALFQRLMRQLIAEGSVAQFASALDIGCNAGFYSRLISDFGFQEVLGIDIGEKYIAKANREFASDLPDRHVSFEAIDVAALMRRTAKRYDFILCTEVIEHTGDPEALIKSITELLTPKGTAIISLPNCLSLGYFTSFAASVLRGRGMNKDLRDHLRYPSYRGPALFRQNGARIIRTSGVNCLLNAPLLALLYRSPIFASLNRLNFWLSSRWPFNYFAQFFFFVVKKNN
jgi:2-polyprenyl-3-methyl-5-hydroxy-6-metoxy-1,4-benzoquinol methylase